MQTATPKTTRDAAGYYKVTANGRTVSIIRNPELAGPDKWIAGAQWDRHLYTDPVATKRAAVEHARRMLADAADAEAARLGQGPARDMTPRYAPEKVILTAGGRVTFEKVRQYVAHPPGKHPPECPIDRKLTALAMVTARGTAWRGFDRAYINAELRMVVEGFDPRDEVLRQWEVVRLPGTQRAGDDRPEVIASRAVLAELADGDDSNLALFAAGYIEAALFCGVEYPEDHPDADSDRDTTKIPEDIAADTLRDMISDCRKFLTPETIAAIEGADDSESGIGGSDDAAMTKAGRDFWFTRNGHGVGFWEDSRWPEEFGTVLDKAAKKFGDFDLYTGDDGRVHDM